MSSFERVVSLGSGMPRLAFILPRAGTTALVPYRMSVRFGEDRRRSDCFCVSVTGVRFGEDRRRSDCFCVSVTGSMETRRVHVVVVEALLALASFIHADFGQHGFESLQSFSYWKSEKLDFFSC